MHTLSVMAPQQPKKATKQINTPTPMRTYGIAGTDFTISPIRMGILRTKKRELLLPKTNAENVFKLTFHFDSHTNLSSSFKAEQTNHHSLELRRFISVNQLEFVTPFGINDMHDKITNDEISLNF